MTELSVVRFPCRCCSTWNGTGSLAGERMFSPAIALQLRPCPTSARRRGPVPSCWSAVASVGSGGSWDAELSNLPLISMELEGSRFQCCSGGLSIAKLLAQRPSVQNARHGAFLLFGPAVCYQAASRGSYQAASPTHMLNQCPFGGRSGPKVSSGAWILPPCALGCAQHGFCGQSPWFIGFERTR